MLVADPQERADLDQLLQHAWVNAEGEVGKTSIKTSIERNLGIDESATGGVGRMELASALRELGQFNARKKLKVSTKMVLAVEQFAKVGSKPIDDSGVGAIDGAHILHQEEQEEGEGGVQEVGKARAASRYSRRISLVEDEFTLQFSSLSRPRPRGNGMLGAAVLGGFAGACIAGPVGAAMGAVGAACASTVSATVRGAGQTVAELPQRLLDNRHNIRCTMSGAKITGQLCKFERNRRVMKSRRFFVTKKGDLVWLVSKGEMPLTKCYFGDDVKGVESLKNAKVVSMDSAFDGEHGTNRSPRKSKRVAVGDSSAGYFRFEVELGASNASTKPIRLQLAAVSEQQRVDWAQVIALASQHA
jgi:hypothetical protein